METVPAIILGGLALCAVVAAWTDMTTRSLPNWLVLLTLVGGLASGYVTGGWEMLLSHLGHFAVALIIGLIIFALKAWGGGDGKFYAAVAAWFPLGDFFGLIFMISGIGVFLVMFFIAKNGFKLKGANMATVPYGVAIGLGAVANLARILL